MLATLHTEVFDVAIVGAVASLASACIVTAGALISKRIETHVKAQLDTGNGRSLGETVREMAQTVEITSAQTHLNTAELLELERTVRVHIEQADDRMAEVAPLVEFVKTLMLPGKGEG